MRELKFRSWLKNYNCYADVLGFEQGRLFVQFQSGERAQHRLYVPIEDCVLEQYTGLKDENGKEIYEGDIVTLNGEWEAIEHDDCSIVTFENGCFRVGDGYENEAGSYLSDWRVIGNIHENADLLERK